MSLRYMRMILFFDLPMGTSSETRNYRKFIKLIKSEGFLMLQKSVYVKLSIHQANVESTKHNIKANVPKDGNIALLVITEKQFSSMEYLLGNLETDVLNTEDRIIEI